MKKRGLFLEEIAEKVGLSEHQVVNIFSCINGGKSALLRSRFPVLATWQMLNGVSIHRLKKELEISDAAATNIHIGINDPSKYIIDKVLRYTGLTYEEVFLERASL